MKKKFIAAVFEGNSPLFFFLVLILCFVGLINISIAFFGAISPSQFAIQEIFNFSFIGIIFLAMATIVFWIGTKTTNKKTAKNEWLVFSPLISMVFLGIFLGVVAVFFPIQTMESMFGKEAGRAIFFRFLALTSICSIGLAFAGMAATLGTIKLIKKLTNDKK